MKVTVDRTEEELIVVILPGGECVNISKKLCPGAKEGDVLSIEVSEKDTKEAKERIREKFFRLTGKRAD